MGAERTKGPWVLDGHNLSAVIRCTVPRGHPDAKHLTGDYETIARCDGDNWKANAAFIVRACNSFEDMLAALKEVRAQLYQFYDPSEDAENALMKAAGKAIDQADAAITRATTPIAQEEE